MSNSSLLHWSVYKNICINSNNEDSDQKSRAILIGIFQKAEKLYTKILNRVRTKSGENHPHTTTAGSYAIQRVLSYDDVYLSIAKLTLCNIKYQNYSLQSSYLSTALRGPKLCYA